MNVFNLDVRTVCVVDNRNLWECALSWDDAALLIANPACFVESIIGRRLGDVKKYPIVLVQVSYPDARPREQDGLERGGDVIVQGIDDTSVITVRVKNPIHNPPEPPDLPLDDKMKVQVVLRLKDRLATAHFHLKGDNHAVKKAIYTLVRNPLAYAPAINKLISKGRVDVIVIDGAMPPKGCGHRDEMETDASDHAAASIQIATAASAEQGSAAAHDPITFSADPTVQSLSVQYDASSDEIAGCHSVDGTINTQPGQLVINGVMVKCVAYAPDPSPDPTVIPPMISPGM